jgi:hypothetical protein
MHGEGTVGETRRRGEPFPHGTQDEGYIPGSVTVVSAFPDRRTGSVTGLIEAL